ncbi:asparagine synthase-related protein [Photobacterium sp. ZSDE20]|uniref:Asparagine synthase-related protein n=1 Tax=Photobacterium pectinilyticum TaxID=2906793 RepID=A0ABT1N5K8_9GAMM|nr:asparagine synthase-related protein [Photobacterium sp. ZSDE20]MCQ1060023.1 asparagine synthase-related protein [Photobacterium sp. ZSDE20]MDD1826954.1 asparagine synthase-related protein [Photobacterium sp. ZSDE20]
MEDFTSIIDSNNEGLIYNYQTVNNELFLQLLYGYEEKDVLVKESLFSNLCLNNKLVNYNESVKLLKECNFTHSTFDEKHKPDGAYLFRNTDGCIDVVTDPFGIEKVFIYQNDDYVILTTKLRLLLEIANRLNEKLTIDFSSCVLYLSGRESKKPHTFVNEVKILKPSSLYKIENSDVKFKRKYNWFYQENSSCSNDDFIQQLSNSVFNCLTDAKKLNIVNSLSGGVDSQTLSLVLKEIGIIDCLSMGYKNAKKSNNTDNYDESSLAFDFSQKHGLRFNKKVLSLEEAKSFINPLRHMYDLPAHDMTSFYFMCKEARDLKFDAVVTGMGGDAFFASKKSKILTEHIYNIKPRALRKVAVNILKRSLGNRGGIKVLDSERRLSKGSDSFTELVLLSNSSGTLRDLEKISTLDINSHIESNIKSRSSDFDSDLSAYNSHQKRHLIAVADNPDEYHSYQAASLNNIRMIAPFIRRDFVSIAYGNINLLSKGGRELQKRIFANKDDYVLNAKKSGFSAPYDTLINDIGHKAVLNMIDEKIFRLFKIDFDDSEFDINKSRMLVKLVRLSDYCKDFNLEICTNEN